MNMQLLGSILLTIAQYIILLVTYLMKKCFEKDLAKIAEKSEESGWVEVVQSKKSICFKAHFDEDGAIGKTFSKLFNKWFIIITVQYNIVRTFFIAIPIYSTIIVYNSRELLIPVFLIALFGGGPSGVSRALLEIMTEVELMTSCSMGLQESHLELAKDYFTLKVYAGSEKEQLAKENSKELDDYIVAGLLINEDSCIKNVEGKTICFSDRMEKTTTMYYLFSFINEDNKEEHIFRLVYSA